MEFICLNKDFFLAGDWNEEGFAEDLYFFKNFPYYLR